MPRTMQIPPDFRVDHLTTQENWPGSWDMEQMKSDLDYIRNELKIDGTGVNMAVLDTGVDTRHPSIPDPISARSFVGGSARDGNGHGQWCCGRTVGRDGPGIAPGANLIVAKVLADNGSGSTSGINAAYLWAADQGADVISGSFGGGGASQADIDALEESYKRGVQFATFSAGNSGYSGRSTIGYPAKYPVSWCNGATRKDGSIATFSSGGREVDDATPGEQVTSCGLGTGWATMSGTSMSCPFRAGLQALIIHKRRRIGLPSLHGAEAWRTFFSERGFFDDRGTPGKDVRFGLGVPFIKKIIDWLKDPEWL